MKTLSRKLATGVLIAGVLVAGAAAMAGAGNNPEVFYACKNADGAIRLVDGGAACKKDEVKVWWNSGLTAPAADASVQAPAAKPTATPTQPPASPTPTPTPGWVDPIAALQMDVSGLQARAATSRPGFSITTLDTSGDNISLAIGADGLGLISYVDSASRVVKVAHCNDTACTDAAVTTLDVDVQASSVSPKTSIAIGADGVGLIAYVAYLPNNNAQLRAVHCTNVSCSSFEGPFNLATANSHNVSLAIGTDGLGLIAYQGGNRVAHCNDAACTSAATRGVDSVVSSFGSIAIGADGLGFISYYDAVNDDLKVAHCNDVACTSSTRAIVDSLGDVGVQNSVAIGVDGLPLVAYTDGTNNALKIAHCGDMLCSSTTVTTLDSAGYFGVALTIGADGLPVITYAGLTDNALKAAHCSNVACTAATLATVDAASGLSRSVAIGADGLPVVSYMDATSGALKAAHCSNRFCIPNVRPR